MIAKTLHSLASKKAVNNLSSSSTNNPINNSNANTSSINSAINPKNTSNLQSNSSVSNDANILGKSKNSENTYSNKNNGLGLNYTMGNAIQDTIKSAKSIGINSNSIKKGAQVVAGFAAGISTVNPVLGYAAYKGSGAVLNTTGKATANVYNTAKNIKSGADKVGNYFMSNSDFKIHRRD